MKKLSVILSILLLIACPLFAEQVRWVAGDTGGDWNVATNWFGNVSGNKVPAAGDNIIMYELDPDRAYSTVSSDFTVGRVDIAYGAGTTGQIDVAAGGSLNTTGLLLVGNQGKGTVNINGGTYTSSSTGAWIGYVGGEGTFNLNAGTATFNLGWAGGVGGNAYINVNGGNLISGAGGAATLGHNPGTYGELNISAGDAQINTLYLGYQGPGALIMTGGTMSVVNMQTAIYGGATIDISGTANLNVTSFSLLPQGLQPIAISIAGNAIANFGVAYESSSGPWLPLDFSVAGRSCDVSENAQMVLAGMITNIPGITGNGILGNVNYDYDSVANTTTITAVPEPVTLILLGIGGLLARRRR